ncbi:MAG: ATP-dependent helicase [bacterium]
MPTPPPLTAEQRQVVEHDPGRHATVLAVAGAGKTTTLVHRVRHLLAGGVAPDRIRAVMFNRAARASFEEKLSALGVPTGLGGVRVQTFHALGLDIVRWAERTGLLAGQRELLEVDEEQRLARQAIQQVLRAHGLTKKSTAEHGLEQDALLDAIHTWKSMLTPPSRALYPDNHLFVKGFSAFEALRLRAGKLTFEDLIAEAVALIEQRAEARDALVDRLDHLIIDEFQDVNHANQRLAWLLAGRRARVMVVGDDDQCIYEWRGARSAWLRGEFARAFDAWPHDRYVLSRTFRFGPAIAQAASRVVARNLARVDKGLVAHDLRQPAHLSVSDAGAMEQAGQLQALLDGGTPVADVIVLVRSWAQAYPLQAALLARELPFYCEDGQRLFVDTWPVKVQRGYLLLAARLGDALDDATTDALELVVNTPRRYVRADAFRAALARGKAYGTRVVDLLDQQQALYPHVASLRATLGHAVRPLAHEAWDALARLDFLSCFQQFLPEDVAHEFALRQSAFADLLRVRQVPLSDVEAFCGALDTRRGQPDAACLRITSVFKAKGLEWAHVFLPRVVEGLFPTLHPPSAGAEDRAHPERSRGRTDVMEAERRLFYVALTRARQSVRVFTDCEAREAPSRFVFEAALPRVHAAIEAVQLALETGRVTATTKAALAPAATDASLHDSLLRLAAVAPPRLQRKLKKVLGETPGG